MTAAFRSFARRNPASYPMVFEPGSAASRPRHATGRARRSWRWRAAIAGERDALPAARTVVAWAQGFVTMELVGAFQLGGDVDEAWEYGVSGLVRALRG